MEIVHGYYGSYDPTKIPTIGVDEFMMTEYMQDVLEKKTKVIVKDLNKIIIDAKEEHKRNIIVTKKEIADIKKTLADINKSLASLIEINQLKKPLSPSNPGKKTKRKIDKNVDGETDF